MNRGDGTFEDEVRYAAGYGSRSVAAGDLDGDGMLDLVVANGGSFTSYEGDVSVLLNECTGSCLADFDGSGDVKNPGRFLLSR